MKKSKKNSARSKVFLLSFSCIVFVLALGYFFMYDTTNGRVELEAGSEIIADIFGKLYEDNTVFVEDVTWIDNTVPGTYEVYVKNTFISHKCELVIVDTIQPIADGVEVEWYIENEVEAELLLTNVEDVTALEYEIQSVINYEDYTTQEVTIKVTDLGGNFIEVVSKLKLIPLKEEVIIELGEELPEEAAFIVGDVTGIMCVTDIASIDNMVLQDVEIEFELDSETIYTTLVIKDTIAPTGEAVAISAYNTCVLEADEFVTNIVDQTEVTVQFAEEIDMSINGEQSVFIELIDESGNTTIIESSVELEEDVEAPVISCSGGEVRNIVGEAIAYKQSVTATDNCDETIEIEFNNSEVDIHVAGEYNLYCTATDLAGNTTEEIFSVVIYEQDSVEAEVYEMADAVLDNLIDDTMTEYEIVEAIYWYCKWNISYVGTSDKSDWITGAYDGLKYHSGDCFTYASVAKVLLTRSGITNMDISKIPAATEHYWNLVDIGDGWVHFDSCARSDGTVIFLWTTAEVLEYSDSHNLSHNYDPDEYPELGE